MRNVKMLWLAAIAVGAATSASSDNAMANETTAGPVPLGAADQAEPRGRSLSAIELTPQTTLDEFVGLWGPAGRTGPGDVVMVYRLDSGERLWLSFSETRPARLIRAILISANGSQILLNEFERTKTRCRRQLDFTWPHRLTAQDVFAAWGPPDRVSGSGFLSWRYTMADGREVGVSFDGDRVLNGQPRGVRPSDARPRRPHRPRPC